MAIDIQLTDVESTTRKKTDLSSPNDNDYPTTKATDDADELIRTSVQDVQDNLTSHINETVDAHQAGSIGLFPQGNVQADNVRDAIYELDTEKASVTSVTTVQTNLTNHINDTTDAHAATAITNTPSGNISSTTVQDAINELDSEKQAALGFTPENAANKDTVNGYVGLSSWSIKFRNLANTFTSLIQNAATAVRTYTFPNKDITVAGLDDIPSKASVSEINTGTNDTKFITPLGLDGSEYLDQNGAKIYSDSSGTDTYTATITPAISGYLKGQSFNIFFQNANTGASTLNVNGLGAKSLLKQGSLALASGDIAANTMLNLVYDGTNFVITGGVGLVKQAITNGVTSSAPSQDAVFDALALKQDLDSDLTAIAGLSPSNDDFIQRKAGAWTNRTPAQVAADLASTLVKQSITDGVIDSSPSQDVVFDALKRRDAIVLYGNTLASPADSTSYFFGSQFPLAISTTQNTNKFGVAFDCTLREVEIYVSQGATNGSNEGVTMYIRENNTTDNLITNTIDHSFGSNSSARFTITGLSISLLAASYYEIKILTPVWATNPASIRYHVRLKVY
jgi:hypothetical protein